MPTKKSKITPNGHASKPHTSAEKTQSAKGKKAAETAHVLEELYNHPFPTEKEMLKRAAKHPAFYLGTALCALWAFTAPFHPLQSAALTLFFALLVLLTLIDLKHYILPNILTRTIAFSGVLAMPFILQTHTLMESLMGGIIGYALFGGLWWLMFKLKGQETMGFGDVKLLAALGAWVGPMGLPPLLLISTFSALLAFAVRALLTGKKGHIPLPYGPFLMLGAWLTVLFEGALWQGIATARAALLHTLL